MLYVNLPHQMLGLKIVEELMPFVESTQKNDIPINEKNKSFRKIYLKR